MLCDPCGVHVFLSSNITFIVNKYINIMHNAHTTRMIDINNKEQENQQQHYYYKHTKTKERKQVF